MFKGVSNWAPYWQSHFGEGGRFELSTLLAVSIWGGGGFRIGHPIGSFILGRKGVLNWAPYWQFHFGEGGGVSNWAPYSVADLHTKVSSVRPPQTGPNSFVLHMFSPKSACVGGWRPLQ